MAESQWKRDAEAEAIIERDDQGREIVWTAEPPTLGVFVNVAGDRLEFKNPYYRTLSTTDFSEPLSRADLVALERGRERVETER